MASPITDQASDPVKTAFQQGRRTGMALAACAVGVVSFISLLGVEKALLAIVLGALSLRGVGRESSARRLALIAIGLAVLFMLTAGVILIVFRDKAAEFVRLLQQLS